MDTLLTLAVHVVSNPVHYIGLIISFAAAGAFIFFLWGALDYAYARGDDQQKTVGRTVMVRGAAWFILILLIWESPFIAHALWGLFRLITGI